MGLPLKKENTKYIYKDYYSWDDKQRWELIDGIAYNMVPAPSADHQRISSELHRQLSNYFFGKPCEVFAAPFDVRLPETDENDDEIKTVVQPDIVIVCNKLKLDMKGCKDAPDLVVEIISPSTAKRDLDEKLKLYEKHGVKEYWVVDPSNKIVQVFKPGEDKKYRNPEVYSHEEKIKVNLFEDLTIDLTSVFPE